MWPFSGGGARRRFRQIDFRRNKVDVPAKVAAIEYDRTAFDESLRFVGRALAIEPSHGPSHYLAGQLLARGGELEASLQHFRAACIDLPDDFQVHADCGVAHSSYGLVEIARPYLERALELLPAQGLEPEHRQAAEQRLKEALDGIREGD